MLLRLIFGIATVVGFAEPAAAQFQDSLSLDVSAGPTGGWSSRDIYTRVGGMGMEFTLAYGPGHSSGRFNALTVGGNLSFSETNVCEAGEDNFADCKVFFPSTVHIGGLTGYSIGRPNVALRAMIGPVAFAGEGPSGAGALVQVSGTAGVSHIAALLAFNGQLLRRTNGETLFIPVLGLGVRIQ
jgi:hypothetical protein